MYLLIGGEKGGSGKSTIAVNLAIEAALAGQKVLLVDGDKQGTATNWIARRHQFVPDRPSPDVVQVPAAQFVAYLRDNGPKYQQVLIDVAGRDGEELRIALGLVDVALFPVRPTINDLETAANIADLVSRFTVGKKHFIKAAFVLSHVSTNHSKRTADIPSATEFLSAYPNLDVLRAAICWRTAYERAGLFGLSVTETLTGQVQKDASASMEIKRLFDEVMAIADVKSEPGKREKVRA
jgi:chromosome partitioning protein